MAAKKITTTPSVDYWPKQDGPPAKVIQPPPPPPVKGKK
jgi:hypothetical protein